MFVLNMAENFTQGSNMEKGRRDNHQDPLVRYPLHFSAVQQSWLYNFIILCERFYASFVRIWIRQVSYKRDYLKLE